MVSLYEACIAVLESVTQCDAAKHICYPGGALPNTEAHIPPSAKLVDDVAATLPLHSISVVRVEVVEFVVVEVVHVLVPAATK